MTQILAQPLLWHLTWSHWGPWTEVFLSFRWSAFKCRKRGRNKVLQAHSSMETFRVLRFHTIMKLICFLYSLILLYYYKFEFINCLARIFDESSWNKLPNLRCVSVINSERIYFLTFNFESYHFFLVRSRQVRPLICQRRPDGGEHQQDEVPRPRLLQDESWGCRDWRSTFLRRTGAQARVSVPEIYFPKFWSLIDEVLWHQVYKVQFFFWCAPFGYLYFVIFLWTRIGWNRNRSWHDLLHHFHLVLVGFEPTTFRSWVEFANH